MCPKRSVLIWASSASRRDAGDCAIPGMKVLIASSEVHPYSKTGGLADMTGALAKWLARIGLEVVVVTPLYRGILESFPEIRHFDYQIELPLGSRRVQAQIYRCQPNRRLTICFIDHPEFYHRNELYHEHGVDYADNAARFIFFSKCVVHLARFLPFRPDLVHVHDWQVGLVPLLMHHQRSRAGWPTAPPTCLTIHNLAYQGIFGPAEYELTNLPEDYWYPGLEFHGSLNCLKAGLWHADILTTVSPRYAREILTEGYGWGLDGVLRRRQDVLFGILNGVDYEEWTTRGNRYLGQDYSAGSLQGKRRIKAELQRELGLPVRKDVPLFGNITRLVDQKGSDLLLGALEEMLAADLQFVLLGSGMADLERAFEQLALRYPRQVAVHLGFDQALSHRIEAASDFFIMPSRFEPCGLNQLYSLRYGAIPIVRATGGLDDAVIDATEDPSQANGIKFRELSVRAVANAIRKALVLYSEPAALRRFRQQGMRANFSWDLTAQEYLRVYRRLVGLE
jgi:starch synthase